MDSKGTQPSIYIHESILPQITLPSSLPYNIKQSFLCYAVGLVGYCIFMRLSACLKMNLSDLKKLIIYFNWRLIILQYCGGFFHISIWISHGHTCVPPSWTPLPSLWGWGGERAPACPRAPALSALLHAWNLHWSSILHMVIYMFQCYSVKSSYPRLLPHSPKVSSLHLCLFCCLPHRVFVTVFLNSIYMC